MSRGQREQRPSRIQRLFDRLRDQTPDPPDDDLRAIARAASSQPRPLPPPIRRRRWPLEPRWTGVVGLAMVVAIALGVGVGALIAPSGTAAPAPIGTGFLPEPGWTVLQTGSDATPEQQALAVATNVRLHPEDDARGIRGSSGLPYSTLQQLPTRGVVIVALFTRRESEPWDDELFPKRELPLSVRDAMNSISFSYQMRPERPLGQYELRVRVGGHHIVLHFYFGTRYPSPQLIASAQRQLDRLVVASVSAGDSEVAPLVRQVTHATSAQVFERTLACSTRQIGGIYELQVRGHAGVRESRSRWRKLPFITIESPFNSGTVVSPFYYSLAWMTAGQPASTTTVGHENDSVSVLENGTIGLNESRCRTSEARVPFNTQGLSGGAVGQLGDTYDCAVPRRVLVRVRTTFERGVGLRSRRGFSATNVPILESALAVRTPSGKPVVYATTSASGRTRLFTARGCVPD